MQSFRIALGLCALLLAWVLLLPTHALGPVERPEAVASIDPPAPATLDAVLAIDAEARRQATAGLKDAAA